MESFFQCVASGIRPVADIVAGVYGVVLGVGATDSIELGGQRVDLIPHLDQVQPGQ